MRRRKSLAMKIGTAVPRFKKVPGWSYRIDALIKEMGMEREAPKLLRQQGISATILNRYRSHRHYNMPMAHAVKFMMVLRCRVDDLYEYTPQESEEIAAADPRFPYVRNKAKPLKDIISGLSYEQVKNLMGGVK